MNEVQLLPHCVLICMASSMIEFSSRHPNLSAKCIVTDADLPWHTIHTRATAYMNMRTDVKLSEHVLWNQRYLIFICNVKVLIFDHENNIKNEYQN